MATKNSAVNANPTAFFLNQSTKVSSETREKIDEYAKTLVSLNDCILCKREYNFTDRVPRILVHCGHTICTACLKNFHKNRRVRCPMCLKLIKNIDTLDRLPVNHTIFSKMMEEKGEEFQKITGKQGKLSDYAKISMPNRDKQQQQQQYIDPTLDPYNVQVKGGPADPYYSNELFDAANDTQTFQQKLGAFKNQMKWDQANNPYDAKLQGKLQNFMQADEPAGFNPAAYKAKLGDPQFDYGTPIFF